MTASVARPTEPQVVLVDATNRRGQPIRCRVVANALRSAALTPSSVILLIEEVRATPAAAS